MYIIIAPRSNNQECCIKQHSRGSVSYIHKTLKMYSAPLTSSILVLISTPQRLYGLFKAVSPDLQGPCGPTLVHDHLVIVKLSPCGLCHAGCKFVRITNETRDQLTRPSANQQIRKEHGHSAGCDLDHFFYGSPSSMSIYCVKMSYFKAAVKISNRLSTQIHPTSKDIQRTAQEISEQFFAVLALILAKIAFG